MRCSKLCNTYSFLVFNSVLTNKTPVRQLVSQLSASCVRFVSVVRQRFSPHIKVFYELTLTNYKKTSQDKNNQLIGNKALYRESWSYSVDFVRQFVSQEHNLICNSPRKTKGF